MIWKTNIKNKFADTLSATANGSYNLTKYKNVNAQIPTDMYKHILGTLETYTPGQDVTSISNFGFSPNLTTFVSSVGVRTITTRAFENCSKLASVTLNQGLTKISAFAFCYCTSLSTISIPATVTSMAYRVFEGCSNLTTVNLYNTTNTAPNKDNIFNGCTKLEFVTLGNGFNWTGLELNYSTRYSRDTILGWFNALYDRAATTTYTLTIGSTNLAKMTAQDIAIATAKNWTLA